MSNKIECPECIGSGETYSKTGKIKKCALCKGKGLVDNALAEDYLAFINIIHTDDEFDSTQ
jgi:DnaJ-class molecular chaperone